MKKIIFTFLAVIATSVSAHAQGIACWTIRDYGASGSLGAVLRQNHIVFDASGMNLKVFSKIDPGFRVTSVDFAVPAKNCRTLPSDPGQVSCSVGVLDIQLALFNHVTDKQLVVHERLYNASVVLARKSKYHDITLRMTRANRLFLELNAGSCRD